MVASAANTFRFEGTSASELRCFHASNSTRSGRIPAPRSFSSGTQERASRYKECDRSNSGRLCGGYRPDEISKSALELAWHIAATEMWFLDALPCRRVLISVPGRSLDSVKNSADLAVWYTDNFEPRFEKLTKLSKDQLVRVMDFRGMFQLPAVMYLNFILNHSIHHRANCRCTCVRWERKCLQFMAKATPSGSSQPGGAVTTATA